MGSMAALYSATKGDIVNERRSNKQATLLSDTWLSLVLPSSYLQPTPNEEAPALEWDQGHSVPNMRPIPPVALRAAKRKEGTVDLLGMFPWSFSLEIFCLQVLPGTKSIPKEACIQRVCH